MAHFKTVVQDIATKRRLDSSTVRLGSTKCLTLFWLFYPRNVPKRVIGLSSGTKNVRLYADGAN